jgi:acyl-CoA reductase-like NAD-dependent aldehyde dehydrogenase
MEYFSMLIDGEWLDSESRDYIDVLNPATEDVFARVPRATEREVDKALQAAKRAFPVWASLSPFQRAEYLWRASDILDERKEEIGCLTDLRLRKYLQNICRGIQERNRQTCHRQRH